MKNPFCKKEKIAWEFKPMLCTVSGQGFMEKHAYAAVGSNNGIHVFRENEAGDPVEIVVHNFGDTFEPADGSSVPRFIS